ncbi:hypothetical protein [Thiohalocapsa sp. ML1]|jgi:hypothetical protein|nr:hypothetical protein [Thiohalocapsa sp. ML1]
MSLLGFGVQESGAHRGRILAAAAISGLANGIFIVRHQRRRRACRQR